MSDNLKVKAYQAIRRKLLCGHLNCGQILSPPALAEEFKISHTPIREAISVLETEGLLEHIPRLGHRVREISPRQVEELYDVRMLLEGGAAMLAVERAGDLELADILEMANSYRRAVAQARDTQAERYCGPIVEQIEAIDIRFHMSIATASRNQRIQKTLSDLYVLRRVFENHLGNDLPNSGLIPRLAKTALDHWRIGRAMARRDGALARDLLHRHIRWSKTFALSMADHRGRFGEGHAPSETLFESGELVDQLFFS